MPSTRAQAGRLDSAWLRLRRLLGRWWGLQPASRQDRLVTLAPLVSVLLFLAAIISAFWYLRNEEVERESESLKRDTEITQQQIRLHLIENQEQLIRLASELVNRETDVEDFIVQATAFVRERPTITQIAWLDANRKRKAGRWATLYREESAPDGGVADPSLPQPRQRNAPEVAFVQARDLRQPAYSQPFLDHLGSAVFQMQVPLVARNTFSGTLMVEYSVESLLRHFVPPDIARRHAMAVMDDQQRMLASTVAQLPGQRQPRNAPIVYELPLAPAVNGLVLHGQGYRTSVGLISNTLFWMVVALSVLTVWMLLGSWRHLRRRAQIQTALVQETNFRRAMENSMLTGMRAMDLEGRITYVNAAFCAMTGFAESELIDRAPPFPYWPHDRIDENIRLLQQELSGRSPAGGIEVHVMRKDRSLFDARMYVSPLIDPRGQQTGWMTSMTNITEAKRIRDQLSASHERFTTVLEGLDASVSVLSVPQGELLFANRSYRLWFGADAGGHGLLTGDAQADEHVPDAEDLSDGMSGLPEQELADSGADPREVFVVPLQKWFDVRSRYLQWTDGRLAQMLIATDITARLRAEEQAALQAERAQVTSRLVTMGEMASSVAHELNQPLTAITNYCNGMVSRVDAGSIAKPDLVAALRKTARQAERAAQIIRRIREFVKKSEPRRQPAHAQQIVEDAVELAGIELRRRNVAIRTYVAQRLPALVVDPILIEQVLMNLLKNAAEAIDSAQLPAARRNIELRVVPRHTPDEGGVVEFSVTDMGPGFVDEIISRLYEAFFSTKAEGLGIGLSLCRSIVESHRGRIRAQNLYNGDAVCGCRFTFTLPVEVPVRSESESVAAAAEPQRDPNPNTTVAS
jgi:PAS domain S-box-containing protein